MARAFKKKNQSSASKPVHAEFFFVCLFVCWVFFFLQDTSREKIHTKTKVNLFIWMLDNFATTGEVLSYVVILMT